MSSATSVTEAGGPGPDDMDTNSTGAGPMRRGNRRVTGKEQYFTPRDTANAVLDAITSVLPDWTSRAFIEPAGGTGTFIDAARARGVQRVASWDIEPRHPEVLHGDFLRQNLAVRDAVCATNPPFGRNNALAVPFFNHAATACELIAFIVPRSWRKWSVTNRLDRRFHLVSDEDLSINYLDTQGCVAGAYGKLRTCIQIWMRREHMRDRVIVEDRGIVTKTSPHEADAALTVFGYGCGTVRTDFPRETNTTQMFLRFGHPRALEALESVDFSRFFLNTAYTEALSMQEINYLLNEYIHGDAGLVTQRG